MQGRLYNKLPIAVVLIIIFYLFIFLFNSTCLCRSFLATIRNKVIKITIKINHKNIKISDKFYTSRIILVYSMSYKLGIKIC